MRISSPKNPWKAKEAAQTCHCYRRQPKTRNHLFYPRTTALHPLTAPSLPPNSSTVAQTHRQL